MKIIIFIDDYLPDSIKVGAKMMHELALEFKRNGNEVTVITPSSSVTGRYSVVEIDGITVYRFRSGQLKNVSKIKRAVNESLLSFRAWKSLKDLFKDNYYNYIIYYSPSIFFGPIVNRLKRLWTVKSYLVLRDFFPQWVIDNGLLEEASLVAKYFKHFELINYGAADIIGIQSPKNLQWFKEKYKYSDKELQLLYNWAEDKKTENSNIYRKKWHLESKVVYFYGGNIGHAQDMLNLVRLAEKMKTHKDAHFIFLGKGDEYDLVSETIKDKKLTNVTLLPSVSQQEFKNILAEVDVGLFSLHRSHKTHNFPGKLLGYMVQELPILGSINPDNDLKETVETANAGFITINGEDDLFYQNACRLLDSKVRKEMGYNARRLLQDKFSVVAAASQILSNVYS